MTAERPCFFFVHVMKTGGTSLVFHMLANFAPAEVYPAETLDRRHRLDPESYASSADVVALTPERRAVIRFSSGHFPYMVRELIGDDVVTLTLLREPVARTISVLKHFKRLFPMYRDIPLDGIYDDEFVFRHFVENHQTRIFALAPDDGAQSFASNLSYREIRAALDDPETRSAASARAVITIDARRLEVAKSNLERVDVLGLSEDFPGFVGEMQQRFGWWAEGLDLDARANVSSEPWDVSPALRQRIVLDNACDVELYEHATKLVGRRRR